MVAGRPSPAPLGPVYPAGSALGGGWGLLWPYRSRVVGWCLHAVLRYINTHEQLADIFTKPLGVMQHNYLKGRLTGFR